MERQYTLGQLEGHDGRIETVAARGSLAVSCQGRGPMTARVWNLETKQCTATLREGADYATHTFSACCTAEGRVLLGQRNGSIKLWDVAPCAPVALSGLEGHTAEVRDIKAAVAGSMVLSGSGDRSIRLWDLRTASRCVRIMEGHSECVGSVDMDGRCLSAVSRACDSTIKLWDLGSGRCTETYELDNSAWDVVMHESGGSFLSSELDSNIVSAWAVGSTRPIMRADMAPCCMPRFYARRLFASRDLSKIVFCSIGCNKMGLYVWRLSKKDMVAISDLKYAPSTQSWSSPSCSRRMDPACPGLVPFS